MLVIEPLIPKCEQSIRAAGATMDRLGLLVVAAMNPVQPASPLLLHKELPGRK